MTRVAGVVALLTLVTYGGLGWLALTGHHEGATEGALLATFPVLVLVGMLILRHRPVHGVGVLFLVAGLSHPLAELLDRIGIAFGFGILRTASAVMFIASWVTVISLMLFFAPDGDLPSRRWRPVVWVVGAVAAVACTSVAVPRDVALGPDRLLLGCLVATGLIGVVSAVSLATRWRRADPADRWRLVLLLVGGSAVIGVAVASWSAGYPLPMVMRIHEVLGLPAHQPGDPRIAEILEIVQVLTYPVIMYVAVVQDGWFSPNVNRVRLVAYTGLTLGAVVTYAVVMSLVMRLPAPWDDSLVPLAGGAVVLVVVVQLRASLEGVIERVLFGHRHSVADTLAALDAAVSTAPDPDRVLPAAAEALRGALRVQRVALQPVGAGAPTVVGGSRGGHEVAFPLETLGQAEGRLVLELRPGERAEALDCGVVEAVVPQLALLMRSMRLAAAAQANAIDVATAREWERARLRRDLHDGLGPVLAGLTLQVDALAGRLQDAETRAVTRGIKAELGAAMAGVRRAIDGLGPGGLDRLGLLGLLTETARSLSTGRLLIRVAGPEVRCHPAVEVVAYRIATEAMTNVVRHSGADTCDVTLEHDGTVLDIFVVDNGAGIRPDTVPGVGWTSMRARAEELGGSVRMLPGSDGGTVVHASLPTVQP